MTPQGHSYNGLPFIELRAFQAFLFSFFVVRESTLTPFPLLSYFILRFRKQSERCRVLLPFPSSVVSRQKLQRKTRCSQLSKGSFISRGLVLFGASSDSATCDSLLHTEYSSLIIFPLHIRRLSAGRPPSKRQHYTRDEAHPEGETTQKYPSLSSVLESIPISK